MPINNNLRSSDGVFTYSVAPKYKFDDHASVYFRVAKGYRPGGPNAVAPNAPAGTPLTFQPDTVTTYEGGVKLETPDHAIGLEVAGFHVDWNKIQLLAVINNFGDNVNGTGAKSDGAEATVTLRPTAGLTLTSNIAYTNARLNGDTDPLTLGARKGNQLPFSPRLVVSVNGDYEWRVADNLKAFVGGSIRSLSKQVGGYDVTYLAVYGHFAQIPAYEVVDARLGVDFGKFEVELFGKNLNNALGITSVNTLRANGQFNLPNGALGTGIVRPRTFGVSVTAGC